MAEKINAEDVQYARETLARLFPEGSTVTTLITHVTQSGMSRSVSVIAPEPDGRFWDCSGMVARVLGDRFDSNHGGVKVPGCGFDAGHHVVYGLARALYGRGDALTHNRF